jgi:hypothetical protein
LINGTLTSTLFKKKTAISKKMKATYHKYILDFKKPSGTSRGVMTQKNLVYCSGK